jgi:hypothetical protein
MDVVKITCSVGLDLLILPSHTMQPLDVACFKPFKQSFRLLRDVWILRNKSQGATKEVLAKWVSAALDKAMSEKNIKSGFRATGIFPFNPHAMDDKMGPSDFYRQAPMPTVASLGELESVDLTAPETMHSIEGTWVVGADMGGGCHRAGSQRWTPTQSLSRCLITRASVTLSTNQRLKRNI